MVFRSALWDGMRDGSITIAFRWWKRPTVRVGGTLQSPAGLLAIDAVDVIEPSDVTLDDARAAGATSIADVLAAPPAPGEGRRLYRIRFHRVGDDPRITVRADADLSADDRAAIEAQLARWDRASTDGPWTHDVLDVIARNPGVVSTVLAESLGHDRMKFKQRVRRLKGLGLTISLDVGYRISPRGEAYRS